METKRETIPWHLTQCLYVIDVLNNKLLLKSISTIIKSQLTFCWNSTTPVRKILVRHVCFTCCDTVKNLSRVQLKTEMFNKVFRISLKNKWHATLHYNGVELFHCFCISSIIKFIFSGHGLFIYLFVCLLIFLFIYSFIFLFKWSPVGFLDGKLRLLLVCSSSKHKLRKDFHVNAFLLPEEISSESAQKNSIWFLEVALKVQGKKFCQPSPQMKRFG